MLSILNQIKYYSNKNSTPVSLKYLLNYGQNFKNNSFQHSQFLHKELPIRISKRILNLQDLPYELNKYSSIQEIHDLYIDSFKKLIKQKEPICKRDCQEYTKLLLNLRNKHKDTEFNIARCLVSFKNKYSNHQDFSSNIDKTLNIFYESRIGLRLLTGHHISLNENNISKNNIGIIHKFKIEKILENCISEIEHLFELQYSQIPKIKIQSLNSKDLIHIPNHVHYILFEILKNSMQAVLKNNNQMEDIMVNLVHHKDGVTIDIFDKGGGFKFKDKDKVFSFLYTTNDLLETNYHHTPISGFGHGLGMSKLYIEYFGGELNILPLEGYGTRTIINLKSLNIKEKIADHKF